jgi:putative transcriptional regulator
VSIILDTLSSILYTALRLNQKELLTGAGMKTHLRKFRFERGELSQQRVADLVSVSRQTIVAIEKGDYSPSVKLALLLSKKLGTTVEDLFELEASDDDQT